MKDLEAINLWRKLGLEELYAGVHKAEEATQAFERTLAALPRCKTCARAALLRDLQETSGKLSEQLISLGILSSALQEAVSAAEKVNAELRTKASAPCRCSGEPCTCHD